MLLFLTSKATFECSFVVSLLVFFFHRYNYLSFHLSRNMAVLLSRFLVLIHCFCLPQVSFFSFVDFYFVFCLYAEAFFEYLAILDDLSQSGVSNLTVYWKLPMCGCGLFLSGYTIRSSVSAV